MASYEDILQVYWPGNGWTFAESGNWNTLQWFGPSTQPTEAAVLARNADTDLVLLRRQQEQNRADAMAAEGGLEGVLRALDVLTDAMIAVSGRVDTMKTQLDLLNTRLRDTTTVFSGGKPTLGALTPSLAAITPGITTLNSIIDNIKAAFPYPAAPSVTPPTSPPP